MSTPFTHTRESHSTFPYNTHILSSKKVIRINKYLSLLLCQIVSPCHDIKKVFFVLQGDIWQLQCAIFLIHREKSGPQG